MPPTSPTPVNRDEAPVRERGDACPGALRLHAADDGRLARLRLPAGLLTYRQAEVVAVAAERLGDGRIDITSRGNLQLRGLGESCGGELAELLYDAGLLPSEQHERVRNIIASPLAGLDGSAAGDVQLWARKLDELLCASPAAAALSGRFLFALDDGRGDVAGLGADVMLLAQRNGTAILHIGTNRMALRVPGEAAPQAALLAALAFLTLVEAAGSGAWRVAELPAEHRLDEAVAARLAEAGIAAVRLTRGALPDGGPPAPGAVRSADGTVALCVHAPLGRLTVTQWRTLLTAGPAGGGPGTLRVTPWRGVVVPGLGPAAGEALLARLRTAGLITGPASPWHGIGACTGRPGCAKALTDVRTDAAAALPAAGSGGLPVYWSGCARRCGHPQGDRVDVVANAGGGYDISVPGRHLPGHDLPVRATGQALAEAVATARTTTR